MRLALVWERLVLSTPRQSGKSTLLREFGTWRLHAGEIFGEPQAITYVANNLGTSLGVTAPLWSRTKADPDNYRTTQTNGRPDVHLLADGSRFSLRAGRATYGGSNSLVVVDEGFAIEPGILADAIEPTILETAEPQIILSSTANRFATALMLSERAAALAAMAEPERALIIEWGAARAEDVADVGTWRKSSPHWHAQRQRLIADRYTKASAGVVVDTIGQEFNPMESFRSQYLNTWPESTEPAKAETGEPLVTAEEWTASAVAGWPSLRADGWAAAQVVAAVETAAGRSAAVATAGLVDDPDRTEGFRILAGGETTPTLADAIRMLEPETVPQRDGSDGLVSHVLAGASIASSLDRLTCQVDPRGSQETSEALVMVRLLLGSRRLLHVADHDLDAQITAARVALNPNGGLRLVGPSPTELVRAFCWAVQEAAQGRLAPTRRPRPERPPTHPATRQPVAEEIHAALHPAM